MILYTAKIIHTNMAIPQLNGFELSPIQNFDTRNNEIREYTMWM